MIGNQVVSSLKWLGSWKLAGQGIATLVSLVVIRLLEPSDYGLMAMALVFLGLVLLLNEMGLGSALVQQKDLAEQELRQVFGLLLIVNAALYAVVYVTAPLVAAFFDEPRLVQVLRIMALRLPLISLLVVPRAMLQRNMQFRRKALVDFVGMMTASFATLGLAWLGYGVWALVYGVLIGAVAEVTGMLLASRTLPWPRFSLRGMRRQASFGGYLTLDRILWYAYTQADSVIIGRLVGNEALGFYYVAKKLASLPLDKLGGIINEVGFSAYSRVQHDRTALQSYYCKAARLASLFSFPVCFGISGLAPDGVPLVLGERWTPSIPVIQVIALVIPLRQLNVLNTPALLGIGRPDVNVVNLVIAMVIMPAAFLAGSRHGLAGIAWAWAIAYPLYFVLMLWRSLPLLGVAGKRYLDSIWPPAAAASIMLATIMLLDRVLVGADVGHLASMVAKLFGGAVVFILAMAVFRRQMIHELIAIVRR